MVSSLSPGLPGYDANEVRAEDGADDGGGDDGGD